MYSKTKLPYDLAIPHLDIFPKKAKRSSENLELYSCHSITYNSQNMEAKCPPTGD